MKRAIAFLALIGAAILSSCAKQEQTTTEAPQSGSASHVMVHLTDGSKVPGTIVASTPDEMIVAGDDGIERKIPVNQVKSVDYGQPAAAPPPTVSRETAPKTLLPTREAPPPIRTTKTDELPVGSHVSVRMNEPIDSATARDGQTFDAQVTRNAKDSVGDVVIPRGSRARVVIRSASGGGHFHGAADLVLDLESVNIDGKVYSISTADIREKGHDNVGINKRTGKFAGGGAALGAIIGAIAGGGKGAAIGAGAGAGAGAATEIVTKGGSIKVPVETVLTFSLDRPLRVTVVQ